MAQSQFLQGVTNAAGAYATGGPVAAAASVFNSLMSSGGDRISNKDYQFYQDLADSGNPREIKRQSNFLEGMAPAQANAYNTYENATYAQDTQRQVDRIKTTGEQLGMSPWEVTGAPGAAPLPSPYQQGNAGAGAQSAGQFLQALTPLKIAEMNNQTQLKATEMNNQTAKDINDQNTAGGALAKKNIENMDAQIAATLQGIPESKSRMALQAAQTLNEALKGKNLEASTENLKASTLNTQAETTFLKGAKTATQNAITANTEQATAESKVRTRVLADDQTLRGIAGILNVLPTDNFSAGPWSTSSKVGWEKLVHAFAGQQGNNDGNAQDVADFLATVDAPTQRSFINKMRAGAEGIINFFSGNDARDQVRERFPKVK